VVAGAGLYFGPLDLGPMGPLGLAIAGVGVVANAISAVLGRSLARDALAAVGGVIALTAVSMLVGAMVLLVVGLALEGLPSLPLEAWLIIGWLALVNTAFAFALWNHTLRTLTAVESSVLNNLMLIQIAVLAWVFLGEALDARQLAGLAIAFAGIAAVQVYAPRARG
jgi:drug/metabolite transporter (DMT)-like permease